MTAKPQDPFFKSIGSLAEDTDKLPDSDEQGGEDVADVKAEENEEGDEERPLQEVESLCMRCGEQVRTRRLFAFTLDLTHRQRLECRA